MANPKIKFKRSAVASKRPSLDNLELGELALNTYDGDIFARVDTSGVGIATTVSNLTPWTENYGAESITYSGIQTTGGGVTTDFSSLTLSGLSPAGFNTTYTRQSTGFVLDTGTVGSGNALFDTDSSYYYYVDSGSNSRMLIFSESDNSWMGVVSTASTDYSEVTLSGLSPSSFNQTYTRQSTGFVLDTGTVSSGNAVFKSDSNYYYYVASTGSMPDSRMLIFSEEDNSWMTVFDFNGTDFSEGNVSNDQAIGFSGIFDATVTANSTTADGRNVPTASGSIVYAGGSGTNYSEGNISNNQALGSSGITSVTVTSGKTTADSRFVPTASGSIVYGTTGTGITTSRVGVVTITTGGDANFAGVVTASSFVGDVTGTASTASVANQVLTRRNETNGNFFFTFVDDNGVAASANELYTDTTLNVNPFTNIVSGGGMDMVSYFINSVEITATATELNVLDGIPGTLTATELGYVDGVSSSIQTQLDAKGTLTNQNALVTLSGVSAGSTTLGTFTGSTISDNKDIKVALQELETSLDNVIGGGTVAVSVSVGSTDTNATFFPTFVADNNASPTQETFKTDAGISYNPSTNTMAIGGGLNVTGVTTASGFVGDLTGNADTATQVKTQSDNTNSDLNITFVQGNNGSPTAEDVFTDSALTFNPSSNVLKVGGSGHIEANVIGDIIGDLVGTADMATNLSVTNISTTNTDFTLTMTDGSNTSTGRAFGIDSDLTYNPATNNMAIGGGLNVTGVTTASGFVGDLTGNVTGNTSGTAGGLSGSPSITVTDITATGNISVAGTLTYEDVTNVDSLGIITARNGVRVTSGGVNVSGVSTFSDEVSFGSTATFGSATQYIEIYNGNTIRETGTSNLKILGNKLVLKNTADTKTYAEFFNGGAANIRYNDDNKLETTGTGVTVFGTTETQHLNVTGVSTFTGISTFSDEVSFGSTVTFGTASQNIKIYTNSTGQSTIQETGSGNLKILGNKMVLKNSDDNRVFAEFFNNDTARIYYNGSKKFETTGTGVTVFGTTETQHLNVTGVSTFTGIGTFGSDVFVDGNLNVTGDLVFDELTATHANITGVATVGTGLDVNGTLDVDGDTQLDDLNVSGVSTFSSLVDVNNRIDVVGGANVDQVNVTGVSTINVSSTEPALRITQTGTGEALLVEDAANPDATPFVVRSNGNVGIGSSVPVTKLWVKGGAIFESDSGNSVQIISKVNNGNDPHLIFRKARGGSGAATTTQSGDDTGTISFQGHSGTDYYEIFRIRSDQSGEVSAGGTLTGRLFMQSRQQGGGFKTLLQVKSDNNIIISDDLSVTGVITSTGGFVGDLTGNADTASNLTGNPSITVTDITALGNVSISGVTTFAGTLDLDGDVDIDGHLEVDNLNVSGVSTFAGAADFNSDVDIDGHLEVDNLNSSGLSTFQNGIDVKGGILNLQHSSPKINLVDTDGTLQSSSLFQTGGTLFLDTRNDTANGSFVMRGQGGGLGTEKLRVDGQGRVGIGTNSPETVLDIRNTSPMMRLWDTDATNAYTSITNLNGNMYLGARNDSSDGVLLFGGYGGGSFTEFFRASSTVFSVDTNGTERLRITSGGDVGIGTDNPIAPLEINGTAPQVNIKNPASSSFDSNSWLNFSSIEGHTGALIFTRPAGGVNSDAYFSIRTGGNGSTKEKFRITSDGKVGIGSTVPSELLDVAGTTKTQQLNVTGVSTFNDNIIATSTFTVGESGSITGGAPIDQGVLGVYGTGRNMLTIQTNDNAEDRGIAFRNNGDKYSGYIAVTDVGSNRADMVFGLAPNSTATYNDVDNIPELLRLTRSGNLGISSSVPSELLDVAGTTKTQQLIVTGVATFSGNVSIAGTLTYEDVTNVDSIGVITARSGIEITSGDLTIPDAIVHSGDTDTKIRFPEADNVSIETAGTEVFRVDENQRIGIGLANPSVKLHIKSTGSPGVRIQDGDGTNQYATIIENNGQFFINSRNDTSRGSFAFRGENDTDTVEFLRIKSDGTVGIGTNNPISSSKLHLYSGDGDCDLTLTGADTSAVDINLGDVSDIDNGRIRYNNTNNSMSFRTNGLERARITAGGNVGIGTLDPQQLLHVNHSSTNAIIQITSSDTHKARVRFGDQTSDLRGEIQYDNSDDSLAFKTNGLLERLRITSNGNVGIGLTNPSSILHIASVNPAFRITDENQAADNKSWNISAGTSNRLRIQALNDSNSGGASFFDFYRTDASVDEFRGVKSSNTWFVISNANRRVGIGSTSPDEPLDVAGTTRTEQLNVTGVSTFSDEVSFGSTATFGTASQYIEIYDGNTIKETGSGNFRILGNKMVLKNSADTKIFAEFVNGGSALLYFNNFERFRTTGTGVTVSGTTRTDHLDVTGVSTFTGIGTFGSDLYVAGNLNVTGDIVYDEISGKNINITGVATISNLDVNGPMDVDGDTQLDDLNVAGVATFSQLIDANNRLDVVGGANIDQLNVSGVSTFNSDVRLGDDDILKFGDDNDLRIYHMNQGQSRISKESGNTLNIRNTIPDQDITINSDDGSGSGTANYFRAQGSTGEAKLYHYGDQKLATKSNGIDVTGHTETDTLKVSGVSTFSDDVNISGGELSIEATTPRIVLTDTDGTNQYARIYQAGGNTYLDTRNGDFNGSLIYRGQGGGTNTEKLRINGVGNVGIATTNPSELLDVAGTTKTQQLIVTGVTTFSGNVSIAGTLTYEDVTNVDSIGLITARSGIDITSGDLTIPDSIVHSGDTDTKIRFPANDTVTAETGGSERVRIDSSGNVGIGTNDPLNGLDILQSSGRTRITSFGHIITQNINGSTTNYWSIAPRNGGELDIGYGVPGANGAVDADKVTIDTSGRFGIGNGSPSELLDITNTTGDAAIRIQGGANDRDKFRIRCINSGGANDGKLVIEDFSGGSYTTNVTFDSDGEVGIGTTDPVKKLHLVGDSRLEGITQIGTENVTGYQLHVGVGDNNRSGIRVHSDGWFNNSSTRYGIFSDIDSNSDDEITQQRNKYNAYFDLDTLVPPNANSGFNTTKSNYYGIRNDLTLNDSIDVAGITSYTTGKANAVYGTYTRARVDHIGGAQNLYGSYNFAQVGPDGGSGVAGTTTNAYGSYNRVANDAPNMTINNAYGVFSIVNPDDGDITNSYTFYARNDHDGGVATNGYLYYGLYTGNYTLKYGLYLSGETYNYLSGNLGIGIANPTELLDVVNTTGDAAIKIQGGNNFKNRWRIRSIYDGGSGIGKLSFEDYSGENYTSNVVFDEFGNVGVGITTPTTTLDVNGTLNVSGISTFQGNVDLGDSDRLRLGDSNDLQIYHDGSNSYVQDAGTGNLILSGTRVNLLNAAANQTMVSAQESGTVELYYSGSKKFETTNTGVTVTGTTQAQQLNVTGVSTFTSTVNITPSNAQGLVIDTGNQNSDTYQHLVLKGIGPQVIDFRDQSDADGIQISYRTTPNEWRLEKSEDNAYYFIVADRDDGRVDLYYGGSKKFETTNTGVTVTGTVEATDFNSTSDIKLKTDIQSIEDPISKLMNIEGVSFKWKSNNKSTLGVIADNVEKTLPELVSGGDVKSVNYNGLVGLLIECVKEQQEQIENLKKQINN